MAAQNDSFAGYPTFIRGYDLVVIRSCPKKVHVSPTWPSHVLVGLKPLFTVQKDESIECRASKKLRARNVDVLWGVKHGPKVFYDHFPTFWKGSANGNTAKSRDTPRPQLMLMVWSSCAKEIPQNGHFNGEHFVAKHGKAVGTPQAQATHFNRNCPKFPMNQFRELRWRATESRSAGVTAKNTSNVNRMS